MIVCAECDGEMKVSKAGMPMMLITGDIDTGNEKIAKCLVCGHKEVLKD
jgi:hypothetical protein